MKRNRISRRTFVGSTAASALVAGFIPKTVWGANDRLNVGCIGIGGKGASDVTGVAGAGGNIVALCDVDDGRRAKKGKDATVVFPDAKFYRDFREMLEKEDKNIDAVTVSTPDHTHCHAAVMAMRAGKHVYCQKPLTHSIWEARLMAETAKHCGVATQMGNQAHAGEPIRRAVEVIRAGVIGKVTEVHAWTNRPGWDQGLAEYPPEMPVPEGLDWDLWIGPAPYHPYNKVYCPFSWRGWWDFGTGALGDMACHIMDMPYWALELGYPTSVSAKSVGNTDVSGPTEATITYQFPTGPYSGDLKFVWYDGNRMPPDDVIAEVGMTSKDVAKKFDLVMIGEKGKFFFKRSSTAWVVTPQSVLDDFEEPKVTIPRVADEDAEWVAACRGGAPALSNFANAGPFTEMVLLGNLAVRLGKRIKWDGPAMKATNAPEADPLIKRDYRKGWEL